MTINMKKIQASLDSMRVAFVDEIPERCQAIESMVLEMVAGDAAVFDELFRAVHSFKGVSAIHGMDQLSLACHYFEDVLMGLTDHSAGITDELSTSLLRYVDVMLGIHAVMISDEADFSAVDKELAKLRSVFVGRERLALVVESSPVIAAICRQVLESLNIKVIIMDDGMLALGRLLVDSFDILLLGKQVKSLNGRAVVAALRASEGKHENIFSITLSSRSDMKYECIDANTCYVRKDQQLAEHLESVLSDKFAAT